MKACSGRAADAELEPGMRETTAAFSHEPPSRFADRSYLTLWAMTSTACW